MSDAVSEYEQRLRLEAEPVVLRLYVAGGTPRSLRAAQRIRKLCDEHLAGRHDLAIVDLYREPERARADAVLAIPTLVKDSPAPRRVVVGDLSDPEPILSALGVSAGRR